MTCDPLPDQSRADLLLYCWQQAGRPHALDLVERTILAVVEMQQLAMSCLPPQATETVHDV